MEQDKTDFKQLIKQYWKPISIFLFLIALLILLTSVYNLGAYNMCTGSNGTPLSNGKCVNYSSLSYCVVESTGQVQEFNPNGVLIK